MAKNRQANTKKAKRARPKLLPISEEMKQFSAMLGRELNDWPHVTSRPMFGLLSFYRGRKIFAALPVTRGVKTSNSLLFKIEPMPRDLRRRAGADPRIDAESEQPGARWLTFEVNSSADLRDALWWLNHAYEAAKA